MVFGVPALFKCCGSAPVSIGICFSSLLCPICSVSDVLF